MRIFDYFYVAFIVVFIIGSWLYIVKYVPPGF